jgi:hypothetical protein
MSFATPQILGLFAEAAKVIRNPHIHTEACKREIFQRNRVQSTDFQRKRE